MKKSVMIIFAMMFFLPAVLAAPCSLDISLLNQDPYPAIPGEYVEIVFQIDGVENPECSTIEFELLEKYPISFDPNEDPKVIFESGTFNKDYSSFKLVPYQVRVDQNALDGDTPIEVQFRHSSNTAYLTEQFNLNVQDTLTDFEIYISDYASSTKTFTLEILNTGEDDIEALTVEIPRQENIIIKGSKVNIVGDLDSNEYTTADFEATPSEGEINIKLTYTDSINERRIIEKTVNFEPDYFQDRVGDESKTSTSKIILWLLILGIVVYSIYKRRKNKLKKKPRK